DLQTMLVPIALHTSSEKRDLRTAPRASSTELSQPGGHLRWPPPGRCELGRAGARLGDEGMKQVVAVLLMFLSEEDTFWALVQLMTDEKHAAHGFFIPGFPKLLRFQAHHEHVLGSALPQRKRHL
ncbi:hypothetical protein E2I00_004620, partial [Balaenoptera physalus]